MTTSKMKHNQICCLGRITGVIKKPNCINEAINISLKWAEFVFDWNQHFPDNCVTALLLDKVTTRLVKYTQQRLFMSCNIAVPQFSWKESIYLVKQWRYMKNEKTLCNNEYYYTFMLNTDIWLV